MLADINSYLVALGHGALGFGNPGGDAKNFPDDFSTIAKRGCHRIALPLTTFVIGFAKGRAESTLD